MFDRSPELKKNKFFESKYAHKEHFNINGADVDSIDVKPENQKDEVPVLVVPGWGATMKSFEPGMEILANKNRQALSLDLPRKGGDIPNSQTPDAEQWYKKRGIKYPDLPKELLRQAGIINGLLDQKKLDKVDVIAHSMGAPAACIAAMLHPEKFIGRTLVLYGPAGLSGEKSLWDFKKSGDANNERPKSISEFPVTESETEYLASTKHITPDYMKANPLRALNEVRAMTKVQMRDVLRYLHDKGIKIVIIGAVEDTFFPMMDSEPGKGLQNNVKADFVDGFLSVLGGHQQIQTHPEKYMAAAEGLLTKSKEKIEEKS